MSARVNVGDVRVLKPSRLGFFAHNLLELCQQRAWLERRGAELLARTEDWPAQELAERVDYYFRFSDRFELGPEADSLPLTVNGSGGVPAGSYVSNFYASELLLSIRVYEPFRNRPGR